jgi:hypothetical protein
VENNQTKNKSPKKQHPKRKEVKLTQKELEELMNINMPIYTRRNGAWRRK